jgi:hypothetical protein
MVGPAAVRQGVAHLRTVFEISERRACFRHCQANQVEPIFADIWERTTGKNGSENKRTYIDNDAASKY